MRQVTPQLSIVTPRKDSRRITYACVSCGREDEEKHGKCPSCGVGDSYVSLDDVSPEEYSPEVEPRKRARNAAKVDGRLPEPVSTGRKAWDAALGGGLVRPSSVLVYGPRGVGKSTSMLRIALHAARELRGEVLYGSSEMPAEHLRMVLDRLGLTDLKRLWISDSGEAEDMLADAEDIGPAVVVWDSIQRFRWEGAIGEVELRSVVHAAISLGVGLGAVSLLVSQVTKDETFIGPNGIGHDVDVLVSLRGVGPNLVAVECNEKNRFAPTPLSATEELYSERTL